MAHLIDKDAVLAEIEKLKDNNPYYPTLAEKYAYKEGVDSACFKVNTLEVKEVDLNEEIEKCLKRHSMLAVGKKDFADIAKHFFDLGLRAQNMITPLQQQRISVMKMEFWTGLQTFNESEMTLSDAYNKGIEDVLEELELKAQKGE